MMLSIIIPVYNAEKYLNRCLKSVFRAVSLSQIETEVILVDNGSTDDSLKIAENFIKNSPLEIKLLNCPIEGAAAVRNYGVKHAKGEYLWFVDADDEIMPSSIKKLIKTATDTAADLVMMGAIRIYPGNRTNELTAIDPQTSDYKSRFVRYGAGPWQFLIRKKWWVNHDFKFKEGIIHEDMEMISSIILYTDHFAAVSEPLYRYHQNSDSVLHKKTWDPHYFDIFPALEGLVQRFKIAKAFKTYYDELEWFFIWNLLIDSNQDFSKFKEGRAGFRRSRKLLKKYFPNWRKNQFLRAKPLKLRLRVRLNYHKV